MVEKRVEWIDMAKGIGLLFVFLGHLKTPFLATWIYTFHMPLFFFLSGLVYNHSRNYGNGITKRFTRLVIPYFTLGSRIFIVWCIIYAFQERSNAEYWYMLRDFLVQRGYWTIWFLAALFLASILQWGIVCIAKEKKTLILILSLTLCVWAFVYYRLGGVVLPWCFDVACVAQFFMNMGYLVKNTLMYESKVKFTWRRLIVLFAINVIAGFVNIRFSGHSLDMSIGMYGNEFLSMISALAGIGVTILLSQLFINRWIIYLGRNSMILFAWHSRIVIVLCDFLYGSFGLFQQHTIFEQIIYTVVTLVIILCVLIPVTEFAKDSKYRVLFGV